MMFKLITTLFLLSSCSLFIDNFEGDVLEENNVKPLSQSEVTTCEIIDQNILISENKEAQKAFKSFLKQVSKNHALKFIDKVVLWSLLQMNTRPDLSSPTAKFQALLLINGKEEYLNTYSDNSRSYPYLSALDKVLKKYKSKYNLKRLALFLDRDFKGTLYASKQLEVFLAKNITSISSNKYLKKVFVRGDETLKQNERIPKLNYTRLINRYNKSKYKRKISSNSFLFQSKITQNLQTSCNFDMGLYKDSLFLINDIPIKSHTFGLKDKKNVFLGVSSQKINNFQTIGQTFLIAGKSNIRSSSLCSFKQKNKKTLWLTSSDSRDPGQHLYHLVQYGLEDIESISELNSMLMFSRHQFLKNPVRLVIESRRSSKAQLNELLKLNIPIYNAKKLGTIWGYFSGSKKSSFLIDDRREGYLTCSSN